MSALAAKERDLVLAAELGKAGALISHGQESGPTQKPVLIYILIGCKQHWEKQLYRTVLSNKKAMRNRSCLESPSYIGSEPPFSPFSFKPICSRIKQVYPTRVSLQFFRNRLFFTKLPTPLYLSASERQNQSGFLNLFLNTVFCRVGRTLHSSIHELINPLEGAAGEERGPQQGEREDSRGVQSQTRGRGQID